MSPNFGSFLPLWLLNDSDGYAPAVRNRIWLKSDNTNAASYMIHSLWPRLLEVLNRDPAKPAELEEVLVKYIEAYRGQGLAIPPTLESFYSGSDVPEEILIRRLESLSDLGGSISDFDALPIISPSASSLRRSLTLATSTSETRRLETVKEFWKMSRREEKLVRIECTVSRIAPFTVDA